MKIDVKGTQLDLTPSIKKYIEDKIGSLDRFLTRYREEGEVSAFVEIARSTKHHRQGDVYYAEATLSIPAKSFRAEHYDADVRVAIDRVRDILKLELGKYKDKKVSEKRGSIKT